MSQNLSMYLSRRADSFLYGGPSSTFFRLVSAFWSKYLSFYLETVSIVMPQNLPLYLSRRAESFPYEELSSTFFLRLVSAFWSKYHSFYFVSPQFLSEQHSKYLYLQQSYRNNCHKPTASTFSSDTLGKVPMCQIKTLHWSMQWLKVWSAPHWIMWMGWQWGRMWKSWFWTCKLSRWKWWLGLSVNRPEYNCPCKRFSVVSKWSNLPFLQFWIISIFTILIDCFTGIVFWRLQWDLTCLNMQ